MKIRVSIADDHPIIREGLRSVIESKSKNIEIINEASNGKDVIEKAKKSPAHVYVLDIAMPILNGIEATKMLIKMDPKSKIIILSIHDSRMFVEKAMKSGAKGYLVKESAIEEVIQAIHEVFKGRYYLSSAISKFVVDGYLGGLQGYNKNKAETHLTKREREILQLIAEGYTNKEIAVRLQLSLNTANVHRKNIMQKLDLHKQADLIRYAIKEGISKL